MNTYSRKHTRVPDTIATTPSITVPADNPTTADHPDHYLPSTQPTHHPILLPNTAHISPTRPPLQDPMSILAASLSMSTMASQPPPIYHSHPLPLPPAPPPFPPPFTGQLSGSSLLNDSEAMAFSNFLDNIAGNEIFLFQPVLPDNLPSWQPDKQGYANETTVPNTSTWSQNSHLGNQAVHVDTSTSQNGYNGMSAPVHGPQQSPMPNNVPQTHFPPRLESLAPLTALADMRTPSQLRRGRQEDYPSMNAECTDTRQQDGTPPNSNGFSPPSFTTPTARAMSRSASASHNGSIPYMPVGRSTRGRKPTLNRAFNNDGTKADASGSTAIINGRRENLSEHQKRSNHIMSEQKRRDLIRQGFTDLTELVPSLRLGGDSKSVILTRTVQYVEDLLLGNDRLKRLLGEE